MAVIQGTNTSIGIALSQAADTWGTAEAVEDKLIVESISWNENAETLSTNSIGSGGLMASDAERGSVAGSGTIEMLVGYENGFDKLLAQFLGTAGTPTEQNNPQGDWLHTVTAASTLNANFITLAIESSSTTVIEFPSCAVTNITLTAENPSNYVRASIGFLFDELVDTSPTNNNAAIDAVTVPDTDLTVVKTTDEFAMNTQGGAGLVAGTDTVDITGYVLNLSRPQEFRNEINDTAGNTVPISTGRMEGSLQLTLKDHSDNQFETAAQAGTEYKSFLDIQGSQIGTGDNKTWKILLPRMQLIETPNYNLTDTGTNPTVLNFFLSEATSNPTGMSDTTPYAEITNTRSTAYIS